MNASQGNHWESRHHIRTLVLLGATAGGLYLCFRMAAPFAPALVWALALAVLFTPLQHWLESKLKRPGPAALVSVLLIGLIVVIPVSLVGRVLAQEAARGAQLIETRLQAGDWRRALEAQPRLAPVADWIEHEVDLPGTARALAAWLSAAAGPILRHSVFQAAAFCLTFYLLFYLLRDRRLALQALRSLSPLSESEMDRLISRTRDTIYATIYGTLAVASVQGLLGGMMFQALGLSAALLWGIVMALLAVVPLMGAFVVWIPAALLLLMEGYWGKALILTLWGLLVVGTADNLLRPVLVGNRLKLHTVPAFISILGGLMVFGPAGLILGPVVLTLTSALLEIWPHRMHSETAMRSKPMEIDRFENEGGPVLPDQGGR